MEAIKLKQNCAGRRHGCIATLASTQSYMDSSQQHSQNISFVYHNNSSAILQTVQMVFIIHCLRVYCTTFGNEYANAHTFVPKMSPMVTLPYSAICLQSTPLNQNFPTKTAHCTRHSGPPCSCWHETSSCTHIHSRLPSHQPPVNGIIKP